MITEAMIRAARRAQGEHPDSVVGEMAGDSEIKAMLEAAITVQPTPLKVGDVLYGFCDGCFGRDSYEDKRVEAIGADWVVVRGGDIVRSEDPDFYHGNPEYLIQFKEAGDE